MLQSKFNLRNVYWSLSHKKLAHQHEAFEKLPHLIYYYLLQPYMAVRGNNKLKEVIIINIKEIIIIKQIHLYFHINNEINIDYILTKVFDLLKFRAGKPVSPLRNAALGVLRHAPPASKCSVFVVSTHSRPCCAVWSGSSALSTQHTPMDVPFLSKLTGRQLTQNLEIYCKGLRQTELISSTRTFSTMLVMKVRSGQGEQVSSQ